MFYLVVIALSSALSLPVERLLRARHAAWAVFAVAAVVSLSVLNGVRDYSIGTDVGVYGNYVFTAATYSQSLGSFLRTCDSLGGVEYGYATLNYVVALFSDSPHVFYFVLGMLTNGIAFAALCRLRRTTSISLGWLVYELVFFPTTLNAMRQSVAIVLVLLAVIFAMESRLRISVLSLVVAFSFHRSAIIGLPIAVAAYLWCHQTATLNDAAMVRRRRLLLITMLVVGALLPSAIGLLDSMGLIGEKYANYLAFSSDRDLLNPILVRFPFVLLAVWHFLGGLTDEHSESDIVMLFIVIELLLLPLKLVSDAAFRIALYFGIFKVVAYPAAVARLDDFWRLTGNVALVAYLIFYFWWQIVLSGSEGIWPFVVAHEFLV